MLGEPGSFSKITAVIDGSHVPSGRRVCSVGVGGDTSDSGTSGHGKAGRASCPPSPPTGLPPDNLLSCVSLHISVCRHGMGSCLTQLLPRAERVFKVYVGQYKHAHIHGCTDSKADMESSQVKQLDRGASLVLREPHCSTLSPPSGMKRPFSPSALPNTELDRRGFGATLGVQMDVEPCCDIQDEGAVPDEQSPGGALPSALYRPKRERKQRSYTLCEVCNIQLNSAAQAQIHYNGKSHQKRLKQISNGKMPSNTGKPGVLLD
ncbi:zinc finger protein 385C isoform X1 [Lates japonicus]|uniref:Zinc finger protein 385C isoform X1 n=1 Tax=Lates japonicus TaxID=270547 RepID=A0AAD3M854_LATJO|nr:zinc finger protein 385C isoform X1 [Lates japonicus]